jgi:hypothetical protein
MRRYQGFEVNDYVFTLDALPLKPSRFCNIGVNSEKLRLNPERKLPDYRRFIAKSESSDRSPFSKLIWA